MAVAARLVSPSRVGAYARISSDREGDGLGVERQLEDCERLAKRKGWVIVDRFVDDDTSAWSGKQRPQYARCLEALQLGLIDGLLVYDLDRLHRQPRELEDFIALCEQLRLTNVASASGDIDLTTADGQFQARILAAVAKKESDDKSRRIRRKHEELAVNGKRSGGGTRPYGYDDDKLALRASEAAIVRECATRFLAGSGWLHGCEPLANKIEAVLTTAEAGPITIDPKSIEGDAAFHLLRLVTPSFDSTNPRNCLFHALQAARQRPPSTLDALKRFLGLGEN